MWFLLVVAILADGSQQGAASPEQYASETECQKALAFHGERFKAMPEIATFHQECVKVDAPK